MTALVTKGTQENRIGQGRLKLKYVEQILKAIGANTYAVMEKIAQDRKHYFLRTNHSLGLHNK